MQWDTRTVRGKRVYAEWDREKNGRVTGIASQCGRTPVDVYVRWDNGRRTVECVGADIGLEQNK